ncbi:13492_t:CDS:1, partial [Funneliformis mosseae]
HQFAKINEILQDIMRMESLQIQEYYHSYQPTDDPRTKMRMNQEIIDE